jgi:RNA polymerase-interacting CarD/CdnL/TRCF family regulator
MDFQIGDTVVHWAHGLGQVLAIEERTLDKEITLYYQVQAAELTVWVPADENVNTRLRLPKDAAAFEDLLSILASPAEPLPEDRRQRNLRVLEMLKDGRAESLCEAIRDLAAIRGSRLWSEYDQALMKRGEKALIGEWCVALAVTPSQAEAELHRLLAHKVA